MKTVRPESDQDYDNEAVARHELDDDAVQNGNRSFIKSVRIAAWGFRQAVYDRNFKIQLSIGSLALLLAAVLKLELVEWAVLILSISLVISLELINTALEKNVDLASQEHFHPLAKAAKDIAAGAVLFASIVSVVIGLIILGPPLWQLFFG